MFKESFSKNIPEEKTEEQEQMQEEQKETILGEANFDDYYQARHSYLRKEIKDLEQSWKSAQGKDKREEIERQISILEKEIYDLERKKHPEEKQEQKKEELGEEKEQEQEIKEKEVLSDKQLIYLAKLEESNLPEEEKERLKKTLKFVDSREIETEEELEKQIDEAIHKLFKDIAEPDQEDIEQLAKDLDLPEEVVSQVFKNQKSKIEQTALDWFQAKNKPAKAKRILKTIGRLGLYIGAGFGLSALTGGIGAGLALAGVRLSEAWWKGKKSKKEQEAAKLEMKELCQGQSPEVLDLKREIRKNILAELAVAKQEQIEGKEKGNSDLGQEIRQAEEEFLKGNTKKLEDLKKLYAKQRILYRESLEKYLEEEGLSKEEIRDRVDAIHSLLYLEGNNNILALKFERKHNTFLNKAGKKMETVLKPLAGGEKVGDKMVTAAIFSFAGLLARACPGVRNVLLAYAGMKLGEAGVSALVKKSKRFEILRQINAQNLEKENLAEINERLLHLAKAQLLDKDWEKANPSEAARLRELIFKIESAKIKESEYNIEKTTKSYEELVKRRISKEKQAKVFSALGKVAGAAGGFLIGEALEDIVHPAKAEEQAVPVEQAEKVSTVGVEPIEQVNKGESLWDVVEKHLEKTGAFNNLEGTEEEIRAQKDYIIDSIKDRIMAEGGLEDPNMIQPGAEIDFSFLHENPSLLEEVQNKALSLSPEQISNITENREFLEEVFAKPVDKLADSDLVKAIDIMGGAENAPSGLVKELNQRVQDLQEKIQGTKPYISKAYSDLCKIIDEKEKAIKTVEDLLARRKGFFGKIIEKIPGFKKDYTEITEEFNRLNTEVQNKFNFFNELRNRYYNAVNRLETLSPEAATKQIFRLEQDTDLDLLKKLVEKNPLESQLKSTSK